MTSLSFIVDEIRTNFYTIHRLSLYENKKKYSDSALGGLWHIVNPAIQIFIYWLVFGIGIRGGHAVEGTPFFVWMVVGIVPWIYASQGIVQGANSIYGQLNFVSKMNMPLSILPFTTILTSLYTHFIMLTIVTVLLSFFFNLHWTHLYMLPYYIGSLTIFLLVLSFVTSTLSTVSRDFYLLLQSAVRMLFYATPILWVVNDHAPKVLQMVLQLNPFYYIIEGYRYSLLPNTENLFLSWHSLYFWGVTAVLCLYGAYLHVKFRRHFVDYL